MYLDRAVYKHLVAIKIVTSLPGLVFMPKGFVSRWRRKIPVYMSPVKENTNQNENVYAIETENDPVNSNFESVVVLKPRRGRPRNS